MDSPINLSLRPTTLRTAVRCIVQKRGKLARCVLAGNPDTLPKHDDKNALAPDVQDLVLGKGSDVLALEEIDNPVKNEFHDGVGEQAGNDPNYSRMYKAMGRKWSSR